MIQGRHAPTRALSSDTTASCHRPVILYITRPFSLRRKERPRPEAKVGPSATGISVFSLYAVSKGRKTDNRKRDEEYVFIKGQTNGEASAIEYVTH